MTSCTPAKRSREDDGLQSHWDFMGFTDEIDQVEFGPLWDVVSKIKYSLTNHKTAGFFRFPREDPELPDEAWIRLGWYLAKNKHLTSISGGGGYMTNKVLAKVFGSMIWTLSSRIDKMPFGGNSIGPKGIQIMTPFLCASQSLHTLWMSGNPIACQCNGGRKSCVSSIG
ncbi:hypothetical protein ACHAXS_001848 [Conticribra weissflogii]